MAEERQVKRLRWLESGRYKEKDSEDREKRGEDRRRGTSSQDGLEEGRDAEITMKDVEDLIEDAKVSANIQGRSRPSSQGWQRLIQTEIADHLSRLGPDFEVAMLGELLGKLLDLLEHPCRPRSIVGKKDPIASF